jgi:hypothetical protein
MPLPWQRRLQRRRRFRADFQLLWYQELGALVESGRIYLNN